MQADNEQIEQLLNKWCQELLPAVESWGLNIDQVPVQLGSNRQLSVVVEGSHNAPRIVIGKNLLTALTICNCNLFNIGWKMVLEHDPVLSATEPFMHNIMALVFAMNPPDPPNDTLVARYTRPGYDKFRFDYVSNIGEQFEQHGIAFLTQITPVGTELSDTIERLGNIAEHLNSQSVRAQLLECQIKFLMLHELAHIALGHLCCATSEAAELEADHLAAEVYMAASAELRKADCIVVDSAAIVTLFSTIGFIEDLIQLVDQSILYGLPEGMREAFRPILRSHPCVRQRANQATNALYQDGFAQIVTFFNENAIKEIKQQFRLGVINTRVFKWYTRIRGLEMQAGYTIRQTGAKKNAESIADMIRIERGWDSIDFQWGPLIDDIFPSDWHTPVNIGRIE